MADTIVRYATNITMTDIFHLLFAIIYGVGEWQIQTPFFSPPWEAAGDANPPGDWVYPPPMFDSPYDPPTWNDSL